MYSEKPDEVGLLLDESVADKVEQPKPSTVDFRFS